MSDTVRPPRPGPPPKPPRRAPGGTLAPLGAREGYPGEEPPTGPRATMTVINRLIRNYQACTPEDQRLIEALAIRLRPGVHA